MKLDTTLIFSLLIPIWGLGIGLMALQKKETRRALTFLVPAGVMILFILIVKLSGIADTTELYASAPGSAVADEASSAQGMENLPEEVMKELLTAANNVTRVAPRMIDANTRLDGAFAGPGATFTYLYTLPKVVSTQMQPGYFDSKVAPNLKRAVCASRQLQFFFDNKVVVTYKYRGNDGAPIGSIMFSGKTCRKPAPPKAASAPALEAQPSEEASAPEPVPASAPEREPELLTPDAHNPQGHSTPE
jgi:hypothetical protein